MIPINSKLSQKTQNHPNKLKIIPLHSKSNNPNTDKSNAIRILELSSLMKNLSQMNRASIQSSAYF